ncbi:SOS response-associated peptidase [Anaerosporobacter sp.]
MCGRYYVDDDTAKEIRKLLEHIDARFNRGKGIQVPNNYIREEVIKERKQMFEKALEVRGEIFPTNHVPILVGADQSMKSSDGKNEEKEIVLTMSKWGFTVPTGKGVLINARSETAFEKKTFRESLMSRRCIIPAAGFYEWDSDKNKIYFTVPEKKCMYMAGLYRYEKEESRFVILTTAANTSMKDIHDRMPLILNEEMITEWIFNNNETNELLHRVPSKLRTDAMYYQQRLPL